MAPGIRPNTAVTFFERNRPTPTSYQSNLDLQYGMPGNIVLEAGYIGNISHHLTASDLSIDQVPPQRMGSGNLQSARPFPQFSNVSIIVGPLHVFEVSRRCGFRERTW